MSSVGVERKTLSIRTIDLTFQIVFGAAGAVSGIVPVDNDGFDGTTPITSSGAGVYILKLNRGAQRLHGWDIENKQAAAYDATKALRGTYVVDGVASATPIVTFTLVNSAGAATQPVVSDRLYVTLTVKR